MRLDDPPVRSMNPIVRAGHEFMGVVRGQTITHRHLRERLVVMLVVSLVFDVVCGVLIFFFERDAEGTDIHSLGTALFFSSTQLLTVSSQMANPLTTPGRVLDVLMEAYAITVVAALAGSFGAFFHGRSAERRRAELAQEVAEAGG